MRYFVNVEIINKFGYKVFLIFKGIIVDFILFELMNVGNVIEDYIVVDGCNVVII